MPDDLASPMTMSASPKPEPHPPRRYTLRPAQRLRKQRAFDAVYKGGVMKRAGPLRVHGLPNDAGYARLGLSVSRRVGGAVPRNRVKRLLRESFRLLQHDLPGAYDLVIVVMRHEPMKLADYQRLLADAARRIDNHWTNEPQA